VVEVVVPPEEFPVTPLVAPSVGVVLGAGVTDASPEAVAPGAADVTMTVLGVRLDAGSAVEIVPPNDVTVTGGPTVAPDGNSLQFTLSVGAGAARGYRRVVVRQPAGVIPAVQVGADLFFVGHVPTIASIVPNTVAVGDSFVLTVNGTHLQGATRVGFIPPEEILSGMPTVNTDGTQLTVPVIVLGSATPGARVVTVTTPAGTSSSVAGANNTLNLVGSLVRLDPMSLPDEPDAPAFVASVEEGPFDDSAGTPEPLRGDPPVEPQKDVAGAVLVASQGGLLSRPATIHREAKRSLAEPAPSRPIPRPAGRGDERDNSPREVSLRVSHELPLFARPPTSNACGIAPCFRNAFDEEA
jgi:hypothetical protein